ncbi:hypothetical protein L0337_01790 [candidate division KSB1 bacterium]|nr:hypothetical protein [candidate division KSB1 bacterium]
MRLSYDSEGDVLNVIFDERLRRAPKIAYELRDGFILCLAVDSMKPIQLTVVNYQRLAQRPTIHFSGWKKLEATERKRLLPILNSSAVSAFLKLDPQSGYGHLTSLPMLETLSLAA